MSVDGGVEQPGATPPLPRSIWVVAFASLAGQAVQLVRQGGRLDDEISLVLSVVLGGLLVGYVSAGVVRTRTVRLVLAWVVLVLGVIGELVGLASVDNLGHAALAVLSLATTAAALAGLATFRGTDWYTWQRTKPSAHEGAPIGQLVAIGVLVGVQTEAPTRPSARPPSGFCVRHADCDAEAPGLLGVRPPAGTAGRG